MKQKGFMERAAKRLARDETDKVRRILEAVPRTARGAEIGCGFGKKLALLRELGFQDVAGVEINPDIRQKVPADVGTAFSPEEFRKQYPKESLDLLVFSHIIEHFDYKELLGFMNSWLEYLKPGGHVLILTPTLSQVFYIDFDHVKPYYPQSIKLFFGENDEQVQAYSPHVLKLKDVYFRRTPFRIRFSRSLLLKKNDFLPRVGNLLLAVAFWISFKAVGRKSGWIGLFRKK